MARQDNVELMRKLYAELAAIIKVGDPNIKTGNLVILSSPGTLIDPKLDLSKPYDSAVFINTMIDKVLDPDWIYSTRNARMSAIYYEALVNHVVPQANLTPQEELEWQEARGLIENSRGQPTRLKIDYDRVSKALDQVFGEIAIWQEQNASRPLPPILSSKLRKARDDYTAARGDVARAAILKDRNYARRSGEFWFDRLEQRYDNAWNQAYNYPTTYFYPTYPNWLDESLSWSRITTTSRDLERRTHNTSTSVTGGLSASWGMWSVGGDYSGDEVSSFEQSEVKNLNLAFDILRVPIDHTWMETSLFQSRAWDWSRASPFAGQKLSDGGNLAAGVLPKGLMPLVPVALLLARNVELSADWSFDIQSFLQKRSSVGGSVGWGPFRVGGRRTKTDTTTYTLAQANGNALTFKEPQIIGVLAEVMPLSPDRDPSRTWPDESKSSIQILASDPMVQYADQILSSLL